MHTVRCIPARRSWQPRTRRSSRRGGVYEDQPDLGLCSSHDTGSFIERMAAANGVGLGAGTAGGALATEFGHLTSTWLNLLEHPYLGGVFVWTGFDYRGECVPFGWPAVTSSFGLMDLCGFPKDISHYWRSRWTDAPVLHLLPHWNWEGREGAPILVEAYTNCEAVELSLNGRSLGTSAVERDGVIHWTVGYEPGMLEARASRNGNVVASAVRETTGAPSAIELDADEPTCCAGGRDVVIVRAAIVDSAGRRRPHRQPRPRLLRRCRSGRARDRQRLTCGSSSGQRRLDDGRSMATPWRSCVVRGPPAPSRSPRRVPGSRTRASWCAPNHESVETPTMGSDLIVAGFLSGCTSRPTTRSTMPPRSVRRAPRSARARRSAPVTSTTSKYPIRSTR